MANKVFILVWKRTQGDVYEQPYSARDLKHAKRQWFNMWGLTDDDLEAMFWAEEGTQAEKALRSIQWR